MIKSFLKWLKTPYYFNPSTKFKLKISFYHGLFIFLFLYIFRPFYLSQFDVIIIEYTIGIGVIAFLGSFFILYVPSLFFKNYFNEDNWTIGRNIFLILVGIVFVAFFLWYFGEMYKEPYNLRKLSLFEFISYTFLVSMFPLGFFVFFNEKNVRRKRIKRAKAINIHNIEKKNSTKTLESKIEILSENNKESIKFNIEDLVYVTSQGNYASFFLFKNAILKEKILRVTLTHIEKKLLVHKNVIRCHKSYLVNIKYVKDISGNARGYLLKSDIIPIDIPVSRKFSKQSLLSLIS